jgi:hypothetical protein
VPALVDGRHRRPPSPSDSRRPACRSDSIFAANEASNRRSRTACARTSLVRHIPRDLIFREPAHRAACLACDVDVLRMHHGDEPTSACRRGSKAERMTPGRDPGVCSSISLTPCATRGRGTRYAARQAPARFERRTRHTYVTPLA